jgi:uncharacterized membrane protein
VTDAAKAISAMTRLRNYFLTGFIVCAPLAITAYIAWSFIGWVDSWVKPYIPGKYNPDNYLPFPVPGFGLIVALFLITMIGFLTANFIGRAIVSYGEYLLSRMPFVRSIYSTLKQIFATVLSNKADMFSKVGIVEYPRKGVWSIVFIASEKDSEINAKLDHGDDPTLAVFMPCTPNPTTGFLMYLPKSDVIELSMSVEDAAKAVISAGLVMPEFGAPGARPQMLSKTAAASIVAATTVQPARSNRTASSRPNK